MTKNPYDLKVDMEQNNVVFLGKGTTHHNHHFLVMAKKHCEAWNNISSITHQLSRRQFKVDICTSVYEEWCKKSSSHHFVLTKGKKILEKFDAVQNLMVTLTNLFAKKMVMIYSGVTFPDYVRTEHGKGNLIYGLPLWLPDKFIVDNTGTVVEGTYIDHNFMFHKMSTKKVHGGSNEKFAKVKNCYVNGAIYSKVNPGNVAVFGINNVGSFDIHFNIVGATIDKTQIRVWRVTKHCDFMTAASKIAGKLADMKGNVRNLWHGVGKMISVGERKEGKEYITNKQFDGQ